MGFFKRPNRIVALDKAARAELAGQLAHWPGGKETDLVRRLISQLKAVQSECDALRDKAAASTQDAVSAQTQLDGLSRAGLAIWSIPVWKTGQPVKDVKARWSVAFAVVIGERSDAMEPVVGAWIERIHPEDRQRAVQALEAVAQGSNQGGPTRIDHRLRHRDGNWRWVRLHVSPAVPVEGGIGLAGNLEDLTGQRERDQFLDIVLTRFELGSQMLSDGLWDMSVIAGDPINPSNEFWWSQQFRALLGFESEKEFPNVLDSWASRLHPEDKERALNAFAAHLSDRTGRTPFDLEYRLQLKNGTYRWFRARGLTKRADDGTPLRAVGALLDIDAQVQLAEVIGALTNTAGELVDSNEDLSRRTEQQASVLEETASSMEEMTSTVQQNAEGARRASTLASEAAAAAEAGQQLVEGIVGTMSEIEQSSSRISEIISVIDGIAFQTNILALNAAVEAARAGEQGRGFAVVATEVRALAQRCTAAAKEIKGLIEDSSTKVNRGSQQSRVAGEQIAALKRSVGSVDAIVAEIAAASAEQSAGIGQINQSVIQMDTMTQQNAALVEEMSASVEALRTQADLLEESARSSSLRAN